MWVFLKARLQLIPAFYCRNTAALMIRFVFQAYLHSHMMIIFNVNPDHYSYLCLFCLFV